MDLAPGQRLGPYEILAAVGAGGMGEVYRASDTRLGRTVAIKVLRAEVSTNPASRIRFDGEARAIAALKHPHICTLFDIGEDAGRTFLVMEFLEGQTLADRLRRGPIPHTTALTIAIEIAEALARAHRAGIVHRDVKPANIMLTTEGAKLLDFGIAKLRPSDDATDAVTVTGSATSGFAPGTLPYMAPEQFTTGAADPRTDIFALGAVLYEMLTSQRAFNGATTGEVADAILRGEPAGLIPRALDDSVRLCLRKDPEERWQSAHDLAMHLRLIAAPTAAETPPKHRQWSAIPLAAATIAAILFAALWWQSGTSQSEREPTSARLAISLPVGLPLARDLPSVAISQDGTLVVLAAGIGADRQLLLRRIDRRELVSIPGTSGAEVPFFSPDGQWIGFFSRRKLWKVPIGGGTAVPLADVPGPSRGADWGSDGFVVFAEVNQPLRRVRAEGGQPEPVAALDETRGERTHRWPQVLIAGRAYLYSASSDKRSSVMIQSASNTRELVPGATYARYLGQDVLFFVRDGQSFATAFDADRLVVIGEPVIVDERVLTSTNAGSFLSVSHNGSAVYVVGNDDARTLTWVDRDGRTQPTGAPAGRYMMPRVSPDGSRVAVTIGAQAVGDVQIYDFRTQVTTQLTQDDRSEGTVEWSPDGSRVMFGSKRDGPLNLYIQQADASSTAERLLPHEREQWTGTWLRDGDTLTFIQNQPIADIRTMRVSDRQPRNVIDRPGRQWGARVSPDERWLAYMSDESGSFEIFVTTFPTPSRRWQVSAGGGGELVWSPTSRELYFRQGPRMMSVPIDPATDPPISQAMVRFDGAFFYLPNIPGLPNYDVAPDGRFLMISGAGTPPGEVEVGVGWVQHLAARLAQRR